MNYKVKFRFRDNPKKSYWVVDEKTVTLVEEKAKQFNMFDACRHVERLVKTDHMIETELIPEGGWADG